MNGEFGWKPHKLDPAESQQIAYDGYWYKGYACGYGTFYGIVGVMGEKFGAPYNQSPLPCSKPTRAAYRTGAQFAARFMARLPLSRFSIPARNATPWSTSFSAGMKPRPFPSIIPARQPGGVKGKIPSNVADSPLCHLSVSKWCFENKIEATSKERSERCGRLTADVCKKAVEILNRKIEEGNAFKCAYPMQKSVSYCGECHLTKGNEANWGKGIMDCTPCHSGGPAVSDKFKDHP